MALSYGSTVLIQGFIAFVRVDTEYRVHSGLQLESYHKLDPTCSKHAMPFKKWNTINMVSDHHVCE